MDTNRRTFCAQAATLLLTSRTLLSQSTSHPDVATIDHDRILTAANRYLLQMPMPLTTLPCPRSPGTPRDFYSEPEDLKPTAIAQPAFTAHRDALLNFSIYVPALASAFVLTGDERYAEQASAHLQAWFINPTTSMVPSMAYALTTPPSKTGTPEGIVEAIHLAEVAQSIAFLSNSKSFSATDLATIQKWFANYLDWLNTSRIAGLARDQKNHHGTSWLLQAAACAHLNTTDDAPLTTLRHFYKSTTIRAQIISDGVFPRELSTANPYRNSLFNLDMFSAICILLSTRFESVWDYELQDGPGMRIVIARFFPFIKDRGAWPYVADRAHFNDLPLRQPSLLFAARAYNRPEYADLWKTLPADTTIPELQRTFPIRQPLLWVTRPKPRFFGN
jgi:hypothetical protein